MAKMLRQRKIPKIQHVFYFIITSWVGDRKCFVSETSSELVICCLCLTIIAFVVR